jgi:cell division protein FtsI/penicillin-binding protein 2
MMKKNKITFLILLLGITLLFLGTVQGKFNQRVSAADQAASSTPPGLKEALEKSFISGSEWPKEIMVNNKTLKIEYTFNDNLTEYVKELLKQYRSDYTTVAVIDNETGKVLSAVGYEGRGNKFDKNLVMTSTHPSASLIKIITTAELLSNSTVKKETTFDFRGRSTTLFRYQLGHSRSNRFEKTQTFETAFAKSNNVIFGKAAIKNTTSENLVKMAEGFGFNKPIMPEFSFLKSEIRQAKDDFALAELASGYNIETVISPIHAASLASVIANDGLFKTPKMISRVVNPATGVNLWQEELPPSKRVITQETSREMQEMMSMTIDGGTARRSFRKMRNGYKDNLEIGGKTGSITGGTPFGKRDWFSAYALPRDKTKGKGISISVMNVNVKKWHVKSALLAKNVIEYYYKNINPIALNVNDSKRAPGEVRSQRTKKHHRKKRV